MCWDDVPSATPMYLGEGNQSRITLPSTLTQRAQLNIRQLAAVAAGSRGHRVVVGTACSIADDLVFGL
jgi:alkanesulfonate monooxygenase SsuD/methylene tetrahydromethanopterin reductase-like flavin-dependent oxidoreductase (luciferase family)